MDVSDAYTSAQMQMVVEFKLLYPDASTYPTWTCKLFVSNKYTSPMQRLQKKIMQDSNK